MRPWGKYSGLQRKRILGFKEEMFRREFERAFNNEYHQYSVPMKKMKRFRSAFTTEQINFLENEFKNYPYIGNSRRKDVSIILEIPERAVKIWFQNRRMKEKKDAVNKDTDIKHQNNPKNGASSNQLINVSSITSTNDNDQLSLPIITSTDESDTVANNDKKLTENEVINEPSTSKSNINNLYKNKSINQDIVAESKINNSPNVIKNNVSPKSSAEFSIHLLKKYKNEGSYHSRKTKGKSVKHLTRPTQEKRMSPMKELDTKSEQQKPGLTSEVSTSSIQPPPSSKSKEVQFRRICSKPKSVQTQQRKPKVVNNADIPLYLKGFYAQPYAPPGNVVWKPAGMPMPTGIPTVIPNNAGTASENQQHMPRRNCSCDCHVTPFVSPIVLQQPTPQVQYVLVPYQNTAPKYGIH